MVRRNQFLIAMISERMVSIDKIERGDDGIMIYNNIMLHAMRKQHDAVDSSEITPSYKKHIRIDVRIHGTWLHSTLSTYRSVEQPLWQVRTTDCSTPPRRMASTDPTCVARTPKNLVQTLRASTDGTLKDDSTDFYSTCILLRALLSLNTRTSRTL